MERTSFRFFRGSEHAPRSGNGGKRGLRRMGSQVSRRSNQTDRLYATTAPIAKLCAGLEPEVRAEADDVAGEVGPVGLEYPRQLRVRDRLGELAEVVVQVLSLDRPPATERVFQAAADRPTRIQRGGRAGRADADAARICRRRRQLDVPVGKTARDVEQQGIDHREADTPARRAEQI